MEQSVLKLSTCNEQRCAGRRGGPGLLYLEAMWGLSIVCWYVIHFSLHLTLHSSPHTAQLTPLTPLSAAHTSPHSSHSAAHSSLHTLHSSPLTPHLTSFTLTSHLSSLLTSQLSLSRSLLTSPLTPHLCLWCLHKLPVCWKVTFDSKGEFISVTQPLLHVLKVIVPALFLVHS